MPHEFQGWSLDGFVAALQAFPWRRRIWRVDMHHTFRPDRARWREIGSAACQEGMRRFHVEDCGFVEIAQHISIMPDGSIWSGRDWNRTPASVGFGMNRGVFMFEAVGNFDQGCDQLDGAQLDSVVRVIRAVQLRFGLPAESLLFHREVPQTEKTCPGTSVSKRAVLAAVRQARVEGISRHPGLPALPLEDPAIAPR